MAPADAIRSQLATIPDYSMQRTLRLVADALDAIAAAQSRQAAGQSPRLTQAQLNQVKAALEASGTHPLQLTGLQQSGFTTFTKAANEFLDSFNAATGQFTASQPAASNLSNGVTGSGAVVLASAITGIVTQVATVNLTAQLASIGSTLFYAVPVAGAGIYRLCYDALTTAAGSAGTLTLTVTWNNGSAANTMTTSTLDLTVLGAELAAPVIIYSAASQNINYSTTLTGGTGSPAYALRLRLEAM